MLQIMMHASGSGDKFAAAHLPDQVHVTTHVAPVQVQTITMRVCTRDWPSKQFSQQDISQRFHHRCWSSLEQVCNPHVNAIGGQADEAVCVRKGAEFHPN